MPLAIMVLTTGMCSVSAISVSASLALARTASLPTRMTGFCARKIMPAAISMCSSEAISQLGSPRWMGRSPSGTSCRETSTGRSMCVAPGLPSPSAYLNARRVISETESGRMTSLVRLVTGSNIFVRSRYWCAVRWILSVETCPVMHTSGAPSELASATPVIRLVAPGPSVARHTPAWPVSRP